MAITILDVVLGRHAVLQDAGQGRFHVGLKVGVPWVGGARRWRGSACEVGRLAERAGGGGSAACSGGRGGEAAPRRSWKDAEHPR